MGGGGWGVWGGGVGGGTIPRTGADGCRHASPDKPYSSLCVVQTRWNITKHILCHGAVGRQTGVFRAALLSDGFIVSWVVIWLGIRKLNI